VLSGRGLCDELITRPEESYRLCRVVVCDLETSRMGAPYIYDISRLRVKREYKVSIRNISPSAFKGLINHTGSRMLQTTLHNIYIRVSHASFSKV